MKYSCVTLKEIASFERFCLVESGIIRTLEYSVLTGFPIQLLESLYVCDMERDHCFTSLVISGEIEINTSLSHISILSSRRIEISTVTFI